MPPLPRHPQSWDERQVFLSNWPAQNSSARTPSVKSWCSFFRNLPPSLKLVRWSAQTYRRTLGEHWRGARRDNAELSGAEWRWASDINQIRCPRRVWWSWFVIVQQLERVHYCKQVSDRARSFISTPALSPEARTIYLTGYRESLPTGNIYNQPL